ncbi:MAG: hypothetical protein Q4F41_18480 [Eubacteriales bacterium]|nr:hypothetical protein [Eubacteriales bacterium]
MEKHTERTNSTDIRTFGSRLGHTVEIVNQIKAYLQEHPANYYDQIDSFLELLYYSYTECNSVETPEFRSIVNPLDEKLRSLVDTDGKTEAEVDEEAGEYMNIVFELCSAYERQSYIEGMKVGARLVMEMWED